MRTLKLLVLDSGPLRPSDTSAITRQGLHLEVTTVEDREISDAHGYHFSPRAAELAAQADQYDLIIIGNNDGSGLAYATRIHGQMRPQTLIVWNRLHPGDEAEYAAQGFEHFAARADQERWILRMASRPPLD